MKYFILFIMMVGLAACGKKETQISNHYRSTESLAGFEFKHKKVKELFVVVFGSNYSPDEWKTIFDLTNVLSSNKKELRLIEGQDTDESNVIRSKLIKKNAEILGELSGKSIFMMSWSSQDENCKIIQKDEILFTCKPRNLGNSLNGGMPIVTEPLKWIYPDPVTSEIKIPYLKILMGKLESAENPLHYELLLRMKLERNNEEESWFKGDVIPSEGSFSVPFFKYGYAEMTLGN